VTAPAMLNQLTISQLAARLDRREVSAREILAACLEQIERVDGRLHAFLSYDAADAMAQAEAADKALAAGTTHRQNRCWAFPLASRTSSPCAINRSIAAPRYLVRSFRPTVPRWSRN